MNPHQLPSYNLLSSHAQKIYQQAQAFMQEIYFPQESLYFGAVKKDPWTSPLIIVVVDWELSTLGHFAADVSYWAIGLRLPQQKGVLCGLQGIDRAQAEILEESIWVQRFFERCSPNLQEHWAFLLVFHFFRLAAIAQGVYARSLQGNASHPKAKEVEHMAAEVARLGSTLLEE